MHVVVAAAEAMRHLVSSRFASLRPIRARLLAPAVAKAIAVSRPIPLPYGLGQAGVLQILQAVKTYCARNDDCFISNAEARGAMD